MKKWTSYLTYAAFLMPAAAAAASPAFTGLLAGLNVGLIQSEARVDQRVLTDTGGVFAETSKIYSPKISDTSVIGGFNIGFMRNWCDCLNWGVEIRANFMGLQNDLKITASTPGTTATLHTAAKLSQQYAAIVKLAYLLKCDTQFYGFIGPQWGNFKLKSIVDYSAASPVLGLISGSLRDEHNNFKAGWNVGVGLEQLLNECTSVGLEYNYNYYGHLNFLRENSLVDDFGLTVTLDNSQQVRMITHTMLLKINYYFC